MANNFKWMNIKISRHRIIRFYIEKANSIGRHGAESPERDSLGATRACRSESEDPDISGQPDANLKCEPAAIY